MNNIKKVAKFYNYDFLNAGKNKPLMIPKNQKSRQNAETFEVISNQPDSVILDTVWGGYWELNPD